MAWGGRAGSLAGWLAGGTGGEEGRREGKDWEEADKQVNSTGQQPLAADQRKESARRGSSGGAHDFRTP
ncbi:hypothetical protein E2C01_026578 [Portunus trituberculatus]|uniref:Uncharacterized protein n=1 Tax=Portunus trituberculatus TaxID=210409 RepID=A0A5B7EIJ3_PORTR|nr:hypothetical protein [Portunus trituberculatus]